MHLTDVLLHRTHLVRATVAGQCQLKAIKTYQSKTLQGNTKLSALSRIPDICPFWCTQFDKGV